MADKERTDEPDQADDENPADSPAPAEESASAADDSPAPVDEPATPETHAQASARISPLPLVVALTAFLVAALSAGGFAWLWLERQGQDPVAQALDDNRAALDRLSGEVESLAGNLRNAGEDIGALEDAIDQARRDRRALEDRMNEGFERLEPLEALPGRIRNLESSLAALQGISTGLRDTWLLAEAEYYLQIANAQLDLANNPDQARVALELADERLASLANPALTDIRRAIANEIRRVEGMDTVDVEGRALELSSLADSVATLPLERDRVEPDFDDPEVSGELSGMDRALAALKASMSDVISVRRSDAPLEPLLPPDAAFFLRSNVSLQLLAARLALLERNEALYSESLADARRWLGEYFDTGSREVTSVIDSIVDLQGLDLSIEKPDISGSLALLRRYMSVRRDASAGPGASGDSSDSGAIQ